MIAAGPHYLFLEMTSTCNLRCGHCHLWKTTEPAGALTTDEKLHVIDQFANWRQRGVVVLTGGETLLKRDQFFALTRACRARGLSSAANTNGTLVDEGDVDQLLTEGPKHLVVSLDSYRPEVFDRSRGVRGTFHKVVGLLRKLVEHRARRQSETRIMTSTVLFDRNLAEIGDLVTFCRELGVDAMLFQPLARTFGLRTRRDAFFERHFPRSPQAMDDAIDTLLALKRGGAPIETTETDFAWMKAYARNPDFVGEQVCGSGERNMMIDQMGRVQLCFSMHTLLDGRFIGNVREHALRDLWFSQFASEARAIMGECRRNCGMLNCHRKIEAP